MKRAFIVDGTGESLDVSKVTSLSIKHAMLHLDQLPADGTWRLTYSDGFVLDFTTIQALRFHGLSKGVPRGCRGVSVEVEGLGLRLDIAKVVAINAPARTFQLERGPHGWQLLYSRDLFPDLTKVKALLVHRVD